MRKYNDYRTWRTLICFNQVMFDGQQCLVEAHLPAVWGSEASIFFRIDHIVPQQIIDTLSNNEPPIRMHVHADLEAKTSEHLIDSFNYWEAA